MKHYEKIKQMSKEELTAFLFLFAQACLKVENGEISKETQRELYMSIDAVLNKEVTPNGTTTSEEQS